MFRSLIRSFAMLLLLSMCALRANAAGVAWQPTWNSAVAQSQRGGHMILVDFYTDWCGWCKKLDADVYPNPAVVSVMTQYVPVRLNAEKAGKALADHYQVTGYPTVLILDSSGRVVDRIAGYMKAADFAKWLNDLLRDGGAPSDDAPATGLPTEIEPEPSVSAPNVPAPSAAPSHGSSTHGASVVHMSRIRETTKFVPTYQGDPLEPPATLALAQKYLDRKDIASASRTVVKIARGGGSVPAAFYNKLGDATLQNKNSDAAWGWYQLALKGAKSPDDKAYAQLQSARAEIVLGSISEATARLKALVDGADTPERIKTQAQDLLSETNAPANR